MTNIDKIRAEIERLKKENETHVDKDYAESQKWHMHGAYHVLFELSNFIDSLTEEPVSEDLNTVAKEYANNITEKIGYRLQLRRAVCFGANWKKEQLIANAVDATVHIDAVGYPYIPQMELYDYDKDIPLAKEGDKYKVILIKED